MEGTDNLGATFLLLNIIVYWLGKSIGWSINKIEKKIVIKPKYVGLSMVFIFSVALYALTIHTISQLDIQITAENAFEIGRLHGTLKGQALFPGITIFIVVGLYSWIAGVFTKIKMGRS